MSSVQSVDVNDVSVIIPVHNAAKWLKECLESIYLQQNTREISIEISVFFDSCTDDSQAIFEECRHEFLSRNFKITIASEENSTPKGVGYAKNKAVHQSCGKYLCFMDADDVMLPLRISQQLQLKEKTDDCTLVGSRFKRSPSDSTVRYTLWANSLSEKQLNTQVFTSHGPTVIMPTWFMSRCLFESVGGFDEGGRGVPEDLLFFYRHLRQGGAVVRCEEELLVYRYHHQAATMSVTEETIWSLRVKELECRVLKDWNSFTIWNGGKQGRKLYRSLKRNNRKKVTCFCDVDIHKIGQTYTHHLSDEEVKPTVPIIHFKEAKKPFIICVKLDLTRGEFEKNLSSLNLKEGEDYHHFN